MNNHNPQQNKIEQILERIEKNELTLKPKNYFRLKFVALLLVVSALIVATLFLLSFILFSLRAGGHLKLAGFGPSGWWVFLMFFPWKLAFIEIALILLLEHLLRSFKFGYKVPVLYLLLGVLVLLALCAIAIDETPLHKSLLGEADKHHLPTPFENLYEDARRPPPQKFGIFRGVITTVASSSYIIAVDNPRGIGTTTLFKVIIASSSDRAYGPRVGERVFIRGEIKRGELHALGMRGAN